MIPISIAQERSEARASVSDVRAWRDHLAAEARQAGAKMFMGKPAAWFEDLHWFCPNGHVSGTFLKCEEDGDLCLACHEQVLMGPPIGEAEFAKILAVLPIKGN